MKITAVLILVLVAIVLAENNHHKTRRDSQDQKHHDNRNHHQKHSNEARHKHNQGRSHKGHNQRSHGLRHNYQDRASDGNETTTVPPSTIETASQNGNSSTVPPPPLPEDFLTSSNSTVPSQILPLPMPLPDPLREWLQWITKELGDNYRCLYQLTGNLTVAIRGQIREPLFPERQVTLIVNGTVIFNVRVHFGLSCSNGDQQNAPTILGQIQQSFNNLWENLTCGGQVIGNVIREIVTIFLRSDSLGPTNIVLLINNATVYNATFSIQSQHCTIPIAQPRSSGEARLAGHPAGRHSLRS